MALMALTGRHQRSGRRVLTPSHRGPGVVHAGGLCGSCQQLKPHPWGKERCEWGLLVALAHESLPFILHPPVPALLALSPTGSTVGKWT